VTPTARRILAACLLALVAVLATPPVPDAGAAEGDLTVIGGQGPDDPNAPRQNDNCELREGQTRPAPDSVAGGVFSHNVGMTGIAVDPGGQQLFVASAGRVLGYNGVVAGNGTRVPATEPVPAADSMLGHIVGLAVDPAGNALWIIAGNAGPGAVYRMNLKAPGNPIVQVSGTDSTPKAIAADGRGNAYVAEVAGTIHKVSATGSVTQLASIKAQGIAVDTRDESVFVTSGNFVYRLAGSGQEMIAGGLIPHADGGDPALSFPHGLAIGHEFADGDIRSKYLYIADQLNHRVLRVDLLSSPRIITTVAGGGATFKAGTNKGTEVRVEPTFLAADSSVPAHLYIAASNQCAVFRLETPAAFRLPTEATLPPGGVTNTTLPPDTGGTRDNTEGGSTAGADQGQGGAVTQPNPPPNQLVPGADGTPAAAQPQTELRVIDQGAAATAPDPAAQPIAEPAPTPAPAPTAQVTPAPTPAAPSPAPAPTPAVDAGPAAVADPGTSGAGAAAEAAPVTPAAPAPAPVPAPPAPASAPAPTAPGAEPAANVGLAHGDTEAPARGATRYAMVRADADDAPVAALAMAGAGAALLATFLCALLVAPGAASKPTPRPRRAH
jgi:hypothetical protein